MSFLDDFDAALEGFEAELEVESYTSTSLGIALAEVTDLIDTALDDLKHQRIVDTNKVTNWLLDIRNLVNG